jgi:hypothetical protein
MKFNINEKTIQAIRGSQGAFFIKSYLCHG